MHRCLDFTSRRILNSSSPVQFISLNIPSWYLLLECLQKILLHHYYNWIPLSTFIFNWLFCLYFLYKKFHYMNILLALDVTNCQRCVSIMILYWPLDKSPAVAYIFFWRLILNIRFVLQYSYFLISSWHTNLH